MENSAPLRFAPLRAIATHLGHDVVWLLIAVLFCVVEGAIKLTELPALLAVHRRTSVRVASGIAPR